VARTAVFGLGELLWDRLPTGDSIGGAPFNVIAHLARFRYRTAFATRVGSDELGDAAIVEMVSRAVDTAFVTRDAAPTGLAVVVLEPDGSPVFELRRPAAFERLQLDRDDMERVVELAPSAIVFGTLAHFHGDLAVSTRSLCTRLPEALAVYDVNLRDGWWSPKVIHELLGFADVVKLSRHEWRILAEAFELPEDDAQSFSAALVSAYGLTAVAISAGGGESSLFMDGAFVVATPPAVAVVDAVGAGDAFTAGLIDALIIGRDPAAALTSANALGALVAASSGSLPGWSERDVAELARRAGVGNVEVLVDD
jgi:fructokinase